MKMEEEGAGRGDGNEDQDSHLVEEETAETEGCWQPLTSCLPTVTNFRHDPAEDSRTGKAEQDQM